MTDKSTNTGNGVDLFQRLPTFAKNAFEQLHITPPKDVKAAMALYTLLVSIQNEVSKLVVGWKVHKQISDVEKLAVDHRNYCDWADGIADRLDPDFLRIVADGSDTETSVLPPIEGISHPDKLNWYWLYIKKSVSRIVYANTVVPGALTERQKQLVVSELVEELRTENLGRARKELFDELSRHPIICRGAGADEVFGRCMETIRWFEQKYIDLMPLMGFILPTYTTFVEEHGVTPSLAKLRGCIEELLGSQVSNVPAVSDFLGKWLYDPVTFVGDEISAGGSKALISVKANSDRKPSSKYVRDTLEMYSAHIDKKSDTIRLTLSTDQFFALIKGKCRRCLAPYKKGHKCAPNAKLIKGIKDAQKGLVEDRFVESRVSSVCTANETLPSPRLSSRQTLTSAHDVTDCCDISVGLPLPSDYLGASSDEELKYEDCISDDESSSVPIIDYGSTSVVLHSIRSHFPSGPLDYWESRLVIDSGATTSIVCQREWILHYTPERSKVKGLDSTLLLDGEGSGDMLVTLEDGFRLKINDVLYVLDAKFNLISVNSIVKDTGYEVLFRRYECLLASASNPSDCHILGYCDDGLYYIACECFTGYKHGVRTFVCVHEPPYTALAASELLKPTTPFVSPSEFTNVTETSVPTLAGEYSLFDAHCVLGHPNFKILRKMVHQHLLKPVNLHDATDKEKILNCPECAVTKFVRSPHNSPSSTNKVTHPLERLHIDLSGPHEIRDVKMYLMAIKDEFTGYIHAEFLKSKSSTDTLSVLRKYVNYMKSRVPQHTIGSIRTDNGAEFRNHLWDQFLLDEGITRDIIAAYTPETNGFAESSNRQLLLKANCLLLPTNTVSELTLFDFATLYAAYLINRTVNIRKGHTPFELLFHKKPNLGNLIRFGSDVL